MNSRRYIGALIIVLTFLGVVYQQQNTLPNQEIVLQFTDAAVTSVETQNTITLVKEQLQKLGADNIQVKATEEGVLKITYYSATNVSHIKKSLSKENTLRRDYNLNNQEREPSTLPIENSSISYNLNVYEIQHGNDADWSFVENNILHIKSDNEQLLNPNLFVSVIESDDKEEDSYKIAYKTCRNIALAISNISHKIPEVRAGPISKSLQNIKIA
jgi:hypothetical protein